MADYQAKQRRRNMVVGGFVILAMVGFLWILLLFRDLPLFVTRMQSFNVLVYFPEAPGVQKDTPVHYCGYQIGRVMNVAPPRIYDGVHKVRVTLAINNEFTDISKDAKFVVMKRGLGSSYIEIQAVPDVEPTGFLEDEMVLEGSVGMASDFFPPEVQDKLEDLVDSIAALTDNLNVVVGDSENQANIKKMLASIESTFSRADETLKSIQAFSDTGNEKVQVLGDKLILMTEQLEQTLSESRKIMAKIESGEGTAGKLINDGRLYEDLLESSQELRMMLEQIKEWAAEARQEGLRLKL